MSDIWPWEGISLKPREILSIKRIGENQRTPGYRRREKWELKAKVIGEDCILRTGKRYRTPVGRMACKRYPITKNLGTKWVPQEPNRYWSLEKREKGCIYHEGYNLYEFAEKGINPFCGIRSLSKYWECPYEDREGFWEAPDDFFWICGDAAYTHLPGDWSGSCTIGVIKPAFFLLPKEAGPDLGVPLYDNLKRLTKRKRRSVINTGGTQNWKGRVWTPEEIIRTYRPATWAQDGSWGYRTPIYMLNRIIILQAVIEITSNKTALALDHISDQLSQTRTVVYQLQLAVDYLLADEGGICGKFNTSECCLEIDYKSEVIRNISKEIRKISYVGTQEWTPILNTDWWDSFWSFKGWWKKVAFIGIAGLAGLLFLPCVTPCLIRTITSVIQSSSTISNSLEITQEKGKTKILMLESSERKEAKRVYEQYQRLKKFHYQEPETTN
ncbi:endogenous retrovirus group 3 member 1 Env polyprotein-like [Poecile atricapillus]|uniref:endogenous retrovirus group 3 member 1 Env polyprotein-like n=1 Tax=Poecile atricapillus TaxID=48891 RepID=UPI002739DC7D|nr:endogenous retrovirus group 3 member 1 Env polyprotein-like [Poecile atricapillus]